MAIYRGTAGNDSSILDGFDPSLNDTLFGFAGDDTLFGGAGNDALLGGAGNDDLSGGDGNDRLTGSTGLDFLLGGDGDDELNGGADGDFMDGGDGIDTAVYTGATAGVVVSMLNPAINTGDAAGDFLFNIENVNTTNFDDRLSADGADNFIKLLDGNDEAYGRAGNDTLDGGNGQDRLFGDEGDDSLLGRNGNDFLNGGDGADRLIGGGGTDTAAYSDKTGIVINLDDSSQNTGHAAGDIYSSIEHIRAFIGDDTVTGDNDANYIFAHSGNDEVNGLGGDDTIDGHAGRDTINGGDGADHLMGGGGNDELNGDAGDDTLDGEKGSDTLTGGTGADTFIFDNLANSSKTITDFEAGTDIIDISDWGFASALEFTTTVEVFDYADGVAIRFDPGELIYIEDTDYVFDTNDFII